MNYIKPASNSRSISPAPFHPRSTQNRPSTQESNLINHSLPPKLYPNEQTIKQKAYGQLAREGSPPKLQKNLGKTQYPRAGHSIIHESDPTSFVYEDSLNSSYYNFERSRVERESVDYREGNRENKFKTLNVRADYNTIINLDDKAKFSKMNTIIPGDHNGSKDFKQRVQEQIKKNLKKNDQSKESIQHQSNKFHKFELTTYNLKPKEPNDQPVFPTIVQFKKNSSKEDSINPAIMLYNPPLPKSRDTSNLRNDDSRRTKSSQRHASVLRSRAPMDQSRRAISNQKGSKEGISPVIIKIEENENKPLKSKFTHELLDASVGDVLRDTSPQPIISLNNKNTKMYYPRPPSQDRTMKRRHSKSLVRPNFVEHLRERGHESDPKPTLTTKENQPTINVVTENTNTQPNLITDYSRNNTQVDDQKPISHYRTQPLLDDQTLKRLTPLQNNKSRDDGLRKTVDSQHEISYVDKPRLPEKGAEIQISNNFVVSPPVEIKRGRFTRKLRDGIKRDDSSKNILDELVEKTGSESFAENELANKKREPSKSPFDELLETSIISYEKDSIVRSRTRKEIEVTVSMTKNPLFKRSRVFVPKGYNGSTEKDGHNASTNVTNSKSTYRNESIQSNLIRDDGSQEFVLKKSDTLEIDFGFEDDVALKKKVEPETKPSHPTRKLLNELNVIDEETQANQKETIIMSQDVISSQEFQRIVGPEPEENESEKTPTSPTAKTTSVKPMFFYCGQKLNKAPTNKKSTTLSQKLFEDDICINGENSDCDVVNSRVGLDTSNELDPLHTEDNCDNKHTINVSKMNLNKRGY